MATRPDPSLNAELDSRIKGMIAVMMVLFLCGLVCDTTGTTLMSDIAGSLQVNVHGVTGVLAIVLMLAHAAWAALVLGANREKAVQNFHRLSTTVWLIWLVPFATGMAGAMLR